MRFEAMACHVFGAKPLHKSYYINQFDPACLLSTEDMFDYILKIISQENYSSSNHIQCKISQPFT